MSDPTAIALVVPSAPDSPHLAGLLESAQGQGPLKLFVVSEEPEGPGQRVEARPGDGFARRANLGLAAARAAGHRHALLCNDDVVLLPGCLEALSSALETEGMGVAGPHILDWQGSATQQAGIGVSLRSGRIREQTQAPEQVDAVGGAAMALSLACWEDLGGFDERFTFYFEDIDFCLRARSAGWDVALCDPARVRHFGGGTRSRKSPEAAWHLGRSHALFCRELPGGRAAAAGRLLCCAALGLGWSARSSGLAGMGSFARGWTAGVRA